MKFKSLHLKAKLLDEMIDEQTKNKPSSFVPISKLKEMGLTIFPEGKVLSFGLHKLVFCLRHKSHELVLKVGRKEDVELDHKAYKLLPQSLRHVYYARIFWHTKYCLLQEYGVETEVSPQNLAQLRAIASEFGLLDISCNNIRSVNGNLKIIDAGIAPLGLYGLWKTADFINQRLPTPLRKIIRKSRLLATVKQK